MDKNGELTNTEKKFLYALLDSDKSIKDLERDLGIKRTRIYQIYGKFNKLYKKLTTEKTETKLVLQQETTEKPEKSVEKKEPCVIIKHMRGVRGRPITLFSITDSGRKRLVQAPAQAEIRYIVDLGSESEVSVSIDSPLTENKYYYEAFWRTHAPSIAPLLKFLDLRNLTKEVDVDIHFKMRIPRVSKDILEAAYFFEYVNANVTGKQYWFWERNIEWLESSFGKSQELGIWDTPYKDIYEVCNLLKKDPASIFKATMIGLRTAKKEEQISKSTLIRMRGDFYYLLFEALSVFDYLSLVLPYVKKGEKPNIEESEASYIFRFFVEIPDVDAWIQRCLRRDNEGWLRNIPFEEFGFERDNKGNQNRWIYETASEGLGVFASGNWSKMGSIMHVLLDTLMMKKHPSRLSDELNHGDYLDDQILRAWNEIREFWTEVRLDPKLKRQISFQHKKEFLSPRFFQMQVKLRDACFELLDAIYKDWKKEGRPTVQTRTLWEYLPGKLSPINELLAHALNKTNVLPPEKLSEYEMLIQIVNEKTKAIGEGREKPAILRKKKRKQPTNRETYDPSKRLLEFLEKVDYDDFINKVTELAEKCPKCKDTPMDF